MECHGVPFKCRLKATLTELDGGRPRRRARVMEIRNRRAARSAAEGAESSCLNLFRKWRANVRISFVRSGFSVAAAGFRIGSIPTPRFAATDGAAIATRRNFSGSSDLRSFRSSREYRQHGATLKKLGSVRTPSPRAPMHLRASSDARGDMQSRVLRPRWPRG